MVDTEIFFAWIKTQSHCNIKTLPTANESEFMSMRSFLSDFGTIFHHSCSHTPQQNKILE
jgi:hypothetical protein